MDCSIITATFSKTTTISRKDNNEEGGGGEVYGRWEGGEVEEGV